MCQWSINRKVPVEFLPLNAFAAISLSPARNSASWDSQIPLEQARKEGRVKGWNSQILLPPVPFLAALRPDVSCCTSFQGVGNVVTVSGLCSLLLVG